MVVAGYTRAASEAPSAAEPRSSRWRFEMTFRNVTALGLIALAALAGGTARGAPTGTQAAIPQSDSTSAGESAVWVPKELIFNYREFTTRYSCDGLQERVKTLLRSLGARSDMKVQGFGCTRLAGPDPLANVRIRINVLQPAQGQADHTVPAHWQTVELPPERDPTQRAADCELIQQFRQQVLPAFTARDVAGSTTCEPRNIVPGSTGLKLQVLVTDSIAPPAAAGR